MGEEVGHGSAAEVPVPAPAEEFVFAIGLVGGVAEPLLPVEVFDFDMGLGASGGGAALVVLPPVGADLHDAAEAAALDEINGVAEVRPTALLHAALEDLLAGADCFGEGFAFFNGVGDGLLEVDVFARGEGVDGHFDVMVVGSGDEDGVDVFVVEDGAVVEVAGGFGGSEAGAAGDDRIAAGLVDVADGEDLVGGDFVGTVEEGAHTLAGADDSDTEGVAGGEGAGGGEGGEGAGDEEAAAGGGHGNSCVCAADHYA